MTTRTKCTVPVLFALLLANAGAQTQTQTSAPASTNSPTSTTRTNLAVPHRTWKGSVALGFTLARGNTDTTLASVNAAAQKLWDANDLRIGADGLYGESRLPGAAKASETTEILHGYSQFNHSFWKNWYAYGRIDGYHDGIADIKYRLTVAPGVGYYFVTNKTFDLSLEGGPAFVKEQLDGESENFATLRLAEKAHYVISPHARLWDSVELLPQLNQFNNYILNAEVGLEAGLNKSNTVSVRTVLQDSYDNVPAAGRLRNDVKLITSLAYKF